MDFGPYTYNVVRIDGDYAYLLLEDGTSEEKCVARALLPDNTSEGSVVIYQNFEYTIKV